MLRNVAPSGQITEYDQRQLPLYAALLDAERAGTSWQDVAMKLMQLAPEFEGAEQCWKSHLSRARWIVGEGLAQACAIFGAPGR